MIRNDGYLLLEDPDIQTAKRELPPHDSIIYLFPDPKVDARLYEWEILIRNDADDRIFVPSDPNGPYSFVLEVSASQVKVTPTAPRDDSIEIQIAGHLVGDHTLLKAEHSGLLTQIVYHRQPGDTSDFTTLEWILYRWRPEESREYIREATSNYSLVKAVDKVTVTLTTQVTNWISTRLLGYSPGADSNFGKVKVTSNDATADYLLPKLAAGSGVVITELNDGSYEKAQISVVAGAGTAVIGWGAGILSSSTTTRYLFPWYSDRLAETKELGLRVPRAGTIRNLRVIHNTPNGNGNNITYTVRVSGVDSSVSVVLASTATAGDDTANSVVAAAGDLVSIKVTKASGIGASPRNVAVTAELV